LITERVLSAFVLICKSVFLNWALDITRNWNAITMWHQHLIWFWSRHSKTCLLKSVRVSTLLFSSMKKVSHSSLWLSNRCQSCKLNCKI
jgi:hypothetical protein